jgi:hypothetical protein
MDLCSHCGQLQNCEEYNSRLWDLHERRKDGRQNIEPLVYSQSDVEDDPDWYDDRENSGPWLAMGRNMHERGLCPECGLPVLQGMKPDDFYDEDELQEMQDLWAMEAAERRMGC